MSNTKLSDEIRIARATGLCWDNLINRVEALEQEIERLRKHHCSNCGYRYNHLDDEGNLK